MAKSRSLTNKRGAFSKAGATPMGYAYVINTPPRATSLSTDITTLTAGETIFALVAQEATPFTPVWTAPMVSRTSQPNHIHATADLVNQPAGTYTVTAQVSSFDDQLVMIVLSLKSAAVPAGVWAVTPSGVWFASRPSAVTLTSRVLSMAFDQDNARTAATLILDNHDGALNGAPNTAFPSLFPGGSITLTPGYASGTAGAVETGVSVTLTVERLSYGRANGRAVVTIEAVGPLQVLSHWHAPQAWQTAAALLSRGNIVKRIANRVGITMNGTGSANFTADQPAFAIAADESANAAIARLFSVESSFLIGGTDLKYKNPAAADAANWNYGGSANHPITELSIADAPAADNWVRLQGPDRYADASTKAEVYQFGPRLTIVRSLDATTDAKANAYAANALRRRVVLDEQGSLSCPLDAGAELFDVLAITDTALGLTARKARIIAISWRFLRGPAGKARYDATYKLGGL